MLLTCLPSAKRRWTLLPLGPGHHSRNSLQSHWGLGCPSPAHCSGHSRPLLRPQHSVGGPGGKGAPSEGPPGGSEPSLRHALKVPVSRTWNESRLKFSVNSQNDFRAPTSKYTPNY